MQDVKGMLKLMVEYNNLLYIVAYTHFYRTILAHMLMQTSLKLLTFTLALQYARIKYSIEYTHPDHYLYEMDKLSP